MSENQQPAKKPIPLALLLLAGHVAVNYQRLIGIFTGISSLGAGGLINILQYLVSVVLACVPVAMLVLVAMHTFQGKAVAKPVSALCAVMGAGFFARLGLTLYQDLLLYRLGAYESVVYELFPQFGNLGALLAFGVGMLQIGSKLRKDTLRPRFRSYGLLFYYLMFGVVLFVVMPAFMDMTISLSTGNLLAYALLMVGAGCLPGTLLEGGEKARNINMVNAVVTVFVAAFVFVAPTSIDHFSYADSHAMPEVTAVTCPSCHKQYTDNGNKRSIERSNMCKNCKIGFEATKDALGW